MALRGLDDVDWTTLHDAYGPAVEIPDLLRGLVDSAAARRRDALDRLWHTVWHQGTVYDCTPVVVPFLVDTLLAEEPDDQLRAEVAVLLASIGSATSFVSATQPTKIRQRGSDNERPVRDLTDECRTALTEVLDRLEPAFATASPIVQAGLVAVCASVADRLPASLRAGVAALEHADDLRLATAARLTHELATGATPARAHLLELASVDADALDAVTNAPDIAPKEQAVDLAHDLAIAAITAMR